MTCPKAPAHHSIIQICLFCQNINPSLYCVEVDELWRTKLIFFLFKLKFPSRNIPHDCRLVVPRRQDKLWLCDLCLSVPLARARAWHTVVWLLDMCVCVCVCVRVLAFERKLCSVTSFQVKNSLPQNVSLVGITKHIIFRHHVIWRGLQGLHLTTLTEWCHANVATQIKKTMSWVCWLRPKVL